jgi:hypothetical protein
MRWTVFGLLLIPILVSAQSQVSIYTGTNFPHVGGSNGGDVESGDLRDTWYPSINLGASIQIGVTNWLEIAPSMEYNLYLFHQYRQFTTDKGPSILTGTSGQACHTVRLMAEARFVDKSAEPTRVYAVTGLGYVMKHFGAIDLSWSNPNAVTHIEYATKYELVQSLGLGVQQRFSKLFWFDLGVKCYADFRNPMDVSLNLGVTYQLRE